MLTDRFVLGHEVSGTVGRDRRRRHQFETRDRWRWNLDMPAGSANSVRQAAYNRVPGDEVFAAPPVSGALKEYVSHPADMCFKLPQNVSTMEGALVETIGCRPTRNQFGGVSLGEDGGNPWEQAASAWSRFCQPRRGERRISLWRTSMTSGWSSRKKWVPPTPSM